MAAHILVIEDNPDNRKLVNWILEDEGYRISCVESAEEGLQLLDREPVDLVLMDISLPGISGKEATRLIRQRPQLHDLPVVALTAHAIKGEHEAIIASGVTGLITKPLDENLLVQRVKELLSARSNK